jgi:hypothetical protein
MESFVLSVEANLLLVDVDKSMALMTIGKKIF